jgi:putative flippase GtrA|tara:strand:- start:17158 stop:17550 length:393 start_codon:yes stop_codon:yes gene_type:complete
LPQREKNKDATSQQLMKFTWVGIVSTGCHYVALVLLVEVFGWIPVIATMIGYAVGAVVNYILNFKFTFKSEGRHLVRFPKFIIMVVAGFILNAAIMYILDFWIYILSQIIATGTVFVVNFILGKYWVFRK